MYVVAKLEDMSRALLSPVTCSLDVQQYNHLGNFVARDKVCSQTCKCFWGTTETLLDFVSTTRGTCCSLIIRMFNHLRRHDEYNFARDTSPSLGTALLVQHRQLMTTSGLAKMGYNFQLLNIKNFLPKSTKKQITNRIFLLIEKIRSCARFFVKQQGTPRVVNELDRPVMYISL